MKVLQVSPWEPPVSGWTTRIKLLRRTIQEDGHECEILDIGPSRKITGRDCIPVFSAADYINKVIRFARRGHTFHCHINGRYFRGMLLMLFAAIVARLFRNGYILTFHGGHIQPFLIGWRRQAIRPLLSILFALSYKVVCNSERVKSMLLGFAKPEKIVAIPAFSKQYLNYEPVTFDPALEKFCQSREPVIVSYLCFRPEFAVETAIDALRHLVRRRPATGLIIVGTGDDRHEFEQRVALANLSNNVYVAGDMYHDAFLTLMARSDVLLRTPVTDGVSATLLEALALGVAIVASENSTRPDGVITYVPNDSEDLARKLEHVFDRPTREKSSARTADAPDTVRDEIELIRKAGLRKTAH